MTNYLSYSNFSEQLVRRTTQLFTYAHSVYSLKESGVFLKVLEILVGSTQLERYKLIQAQTMYINKTTTNST